MLPHHYGHKDEVIFEAGETAPEPQAQSFKRPRDKGVLHSEETSRQRYNDIYDLPLTDESGADKVRNIRRLETIITTKI